MKLFQSENPVDLFRVAPFAGAWIEIRLKVMMNQREIVAPFAGAWIEIISGYDCFSTDIVAPFAGAWIEIQNSFPCLTKWKSLPSRERGLKFNSNCKYDNSHYVAPFAGAWIEILMMSAGNPAGIVAPHAGAWIEIVFLDIQPFLYLRRSPCGSVD